MKNTYFNFDRYDVPTHSQESLINYFVHGYEPGGFMTAVLQNNLFGAASKADHVNKQYLAQIASWIVNNAPQGSWGSEEAVRSWLNKSPARERFEKEYLIHLLKTEVVA